MYFQHYYLAGHRIDVKSDGMKLVQKGEVMNHTLTTQLLLHHYIRKWQGCVYTCVWVCLVLYVCECKGFLKKI